MRTLIPDKLFSLLVFFILITSTIYGQTFYNQNFNSSTADAVYKPNIKTVLLTIPGEELGFPIIPLREGAELVLSFDDLDAEYTDYQYTFIHCDENWNPSDLSQFEYLEGFFQNSIEDYEYSINTSVEYIHYSLRFPNDQIRFKKSGNYLLKVFENYKEDNPVLIKRFCIVDQELSLSGRVKFTQHSQLYKKSQSIDFEIHTSVTKFSDPYNQLKVVILQNFDWNKSVFGLKPAFVQSDKLIYQYEKENAFPGGSEFRYFEFKDLDFASRYVERIGRYDSYFQVELRKEEDHLYKPYTYHPDFNGQYLIRTEDRMNSLLEAEYAFVHFTLPKDMPVSGHRLYVYGALSDYLLNERNELKYDFNEKAYLTTLLLKQGLYNYNIAVKNIENETVSFDYFDGSHSETENTYTILIYYEDYSEQAIRLIGHLQLNSRN